MRTTVHKIQYIQYRMMCHPPLFHQQNNHQLGRHQHVENCGLNCQKTLRHRRPHCSVSQQTHNKSVVAAERKWKRQVAMSVSDIKTSKHQEL